MLRWSSTDLAAKAGVGAQTIIRFEAVDSVPPSRSSTLLDVKFALEAAGIVFLPSGDDRGPGVRLRDPS
jgi:hypothetical protein